MNAFFINKAHSLSTIYDISCHMMTICLERLIKSLRKGEHALKLTKSGY